MRCSKCHAFRGVYSSIIPPPGEGGGGEESKGLWAREENQRRVKKIGRAGGKEGENFGGLSYFIPSWARDGRGEGQDTIRYRPMW